MRRAALALLALVLAGCGGGDGRSREEYAERFHDARNRIERLENLFRTPTNREAQLEILRDTETELRAIGDELAAIESPEDLEPEHRELVEAVRGQADSLGAVAEDYAEDGSIDEVADEAREALDRMLAALDALDVQLSSE